jgi:hypothetical protein
MNVSDLRKVLGLSEDEDLELSGGEEKKHSTSRRKSMEEMNLIRMTPEAAAAASSRIPSAVPGPSTSSSGRTQRSLSVGQVLFNKTHASSSKLGKSSVLKVGKGSVAEDEEGEDQDAFFDLLSKCQAERMNDQRCTMPQSSGRGNNTLQCSGDSDSSRPPLVSKGSFNQQHHNHLRMLGNKENKDKKAKTLPARANSLPSGPNYPAKSPPPVDAGQ